MGRWNDISSDGCQHALWCSVRWNYGWRPSLGSLASQKHESRSGDPVSPWLHASSLPGCYEETSTPLDQRSTCEQLRIGAKWADQISDSSIEMKNYLPRGLLRRDKSLSLSIIYFSQFSYIQVQSSFHGKGKYTLLLLQYILCQVVTHIVNMQQSSAQLLLSTTRRKVVLY